MTRTPCRLPLVWVAVILALPVESARAQASTGAIAGIVRDESGAAAAGAVVAITNRATGHERRVTTSDRGHYAAALLSPGEYVVRAGTDRLSAPAVAVTVLGGMSAAANLVLGPAPLTEELTVRAAARVRDVHHQVTGWIDRAQIETAPLNGRSVLELVKVEPGVTTPARPIGGRVFVSSLGAGLNPIPRVGFTRVTVDGANVETPGTVGVLLQVSPDAVEQVQVSTASFDVSTGPATSGAVDVITRSGGNTLQGSVFSLYRGRRWADSPAFWRHQSGASLGGPLRPSRAFFFSSVERHDQRDLVRVTLTDPGLLHLGGTFVSPHAGTQITGRVDVHLSDRHRAFIRYTRDAGDTRGPSTTVALPSAWANRPARAGQAMAALTSILTSRVVNELRVSSYATRVAMEPIAARDCPPPCVGQGAPLIHLTQSPGGPSVLTLGAAATTASTGRRLELVNTVAWQAGPHLLRFGFDWEHSTNSVFTLDHDPATLTLWAPAALQQLAPGLPVPAPLNTTSDFLQLPLLHFNTSVGSGQVLHRRFDPTRRFNMFRWNVSDRWHITDRLTLNMGVAWSFESGVLNDDLPKPAWLALLVGTDRLTPPASASHLSGALGVAWTPTGGGRTVVRAGIGRYVDSLSKTVALNLARERTLLAPLGTSRLIVSGANLVHDGRRLQFTHPTTFSGGDVMAILPGIRAALEQTLNPENRDFSIVNLDRTKEGTNLYDPSYSTPRAIHGSIGITRRFGQGLTLDADVVWKRFTHTFINGIDYNRFSSARGPVIPRCPAAERTEVGVICTNGSLYFDTTSGRARYHGVLVRVDQALGRHGRLMASYAFGSFVGSNGTGTATTETSEGRAFGFNNDDWSENIGPLPTDVRHVLNLSGRIVAPWRLEVSFNVSSYSRPPFSAWVAGMDFNGDGTTNDLLPGTRVNEFGRGLNSGDLIRLVEDYNTRHAGRLTAGGQLAPTVTLPGHFAFNDNFFALDLRVTRTFSPSRVLRLSAFIDIFNVFDTQNLTGYSGNLRATSTFGRPSGRIGQAFGSGGPRTAQIGLRAGF